MGFAVYHMEKGKGGSGGIGRHIDRLESKYGYSTYQHADPSLREQNREFILNEHCAKPLPKAIEDRIKEGYTQTKEIRKDAVKFQTHVLTGSHEEMKEIFADKSTADKWINANIDWMCQKYGKENIVRFTLHMDEKTPHIHVITVPITSDGRLSAKSYANGKKALRELQTDYAQKMEVFGLERGLERVGIKHESAQEYYARNKRIDDYLEEPNIKPIEPKKSFLSNNMNEIYQQNKDLSLLVASFTDTLRKQERKIEELSKTSQKTIDTNRFLILNKESIVKNEVDSLTSTYKTQISQKNHLIDKQRQILDNPSLLIQRAKEIEEAQQKQKNHLVEKLETDIFKSIVEMVQQGETTIGVGVVGTLIRKLAPTEELGIRNPWTALEHITDNRNSAYQEKLYPKVLALLHVLEVTMGIQIFGKDEFVTEDSFVELSTSQISNTKLLQELKSTFLREVILQMCNEKISIEVNFLDKHIRQFAPEQKIGVDNPWLALDILTDDKRSKFESNLYYTAKHIEDIFNCGIEIPKICLLEEEEELSLEKKKRRVKGRGMGF